MGGIQIKNKGLGKNIGRKEGKVVGRKKKVGRFGLS